MQHLAHARRSFTLSSRWIVLPALAALAGCGSDAMSLGSNESAVQESECLAPTEGDIMVSSQEDIEALRGCRELPGSLRIIDPVGDPVLSLEPLAELQRIHGQLRISGPITSLAGLESLESVGLLDLRKTKLTDLLPLRGLTEVETPADWRVNGVQIEDCDELTDLRGLENLNWGSLQIVQSDGLVSLQGLQAPERIESVRLLYSPQISDVSALATVRTAGFIDLSGTAITNLDDFALERVDTLVLSQDSALTNLDGLDRLEEVGDLIVIDNDALVRMDLPQLRDYENISISDNDALLSINEPVAGFATTGGGADPNGGLLGFPRGALTISNNPALSRITVTDPYDFEAIIISQNAGLTALDMPNVSRADNIWIQGNAALASVAVPLLRQVSRLKLLDNPALSVAPFAGVQTFETEINGNLDTLEP